MLFPSGEIATVAALPFRVIRSTRMSRSMSLPFFRHFLAYRSQGQNLSFPLRSSQRAHPFLDARRAHTSSVLEVNYASFLTHFQASRPKAVLLAQAPLIPLYLADFSACYSRPTAARPGRPEARSRRRNRQTADLHATNGRPDFQLQRTRLPGSRNLEIRYRHPREKRLQDRKGNCRHSHFLGRVLRQRKTRHSLHHG